MSTDHAGRIDKRRVADRFKASAATYERMAVVQKEISKQLMAIIDRCDIGGWSRVLEIGCCTGNLTEFLCSRVYIDDLFVNDLVPEFCNYTKMRIAGHAGSVACIPGDIEQASLPKNLDLVISSSTFQWMTDLPALIGKCAVALEPGGHLAFSIFGPGTMTEIGALTGRSLRYHPPAVIKGMVEKHFRLIISHTERKRLYFPSVRAVLRHILDTGVGGVPGERLTQSRLKEFERLYSERFQTGEGLPVSYVSTFVVAEKPYEEGP